MEKVAYLFSIFPEYAYKILSGEKKFEYRKKTAALYLPKLIIYATDPVSKIIGEVSVDNILCCTPLEIWKKTNKYGGIDEERFFAYFKDKDLAYAYSLSNPILYNKSISLNKISISNAPQSFIYLNQCHLDMLDYALQKNQSDR